MHKMDVHLWAKLDREGRLESVQSSCTQPSPGSSPVIPIGGQGGGNVYQWDNTANTAARSEKFVPYVEKKELVYKLDAKVDEMALIITQMAELNKRVKVQEKLIEQYEEKFQQNKKVIAALEKENEELKKRMIVSCKSSSLQPTLVNCPKSKRPSSWPIDIGVSQLLDQHDAMDKKCFDQDEKGALHCNGNKRDGTLFRVQRPSFLDVSVDKSDILVSSADNGGNSPRCLKTPINNVYSYTKTKNVNIKCANFSSINAELQQEDDSATRTMASMCSLEPRDRYGYLDMKHAREIREDKDCFYSFKQKIGENLEFDIRRSEIVCQSCENEAIHSTWLNVKEGNFITRQEDTDVCEDYISYMDSSHDYYCINEENIQDINNRPPLPNPRTSRLHRSNTDCTIFPEDLTYGQLPRDRSSSLPNDPIFPTKNLRKEKKKKKLIKSMSSCTFENLKHLERSADCGSSMMEKRSLDNDVKKDDALNRVLKDMRTTMEWNKSKKKLISRSHLNTVDNVEKRLKSTVQAVYGAYTTWYGEQRSRSKKFSKERLMQKMKKNMAGKSGMDDLQCDDFISKCIDLVHRTVHQVKTP